MRLLLATLGMVLCFVALDLVSLASMSPPRVTFNGVEQPPNPHHQTAATRTCVIAAILGLAGLGLIGFAERGRAGQKKLPVVYALLAFLLAYGFCMVSQLLVILFAR